MDIEQLKTLKSVRDFISEEHFAHIAKELAGENYSSALEPRLTGLNDEDEFCEITRLMGTATHLVKLEQRRLVPADYIVPDFLCRFRSKLYASGPADNLQQLTCLMEVKSTRSERFKIGGAHLRRLRNFADFLGLPLLFAVRYRQYDFRPFWVIEEDQRQRSTFSLSSNAFDRDLHGILWDSYQLGIDPAAILVSTWEHGLASMTLHAEYGGLRSFEIRTSHGTHEFTGSDAGAAKMLFDVFNPAESEVTVSSQLTFERSGVLFPVPSLVEALFIVDHHFRYDLLGEDPQPKAPPRWGPSTLVDTLRIPFERLIEDLIDRGILFRWAFDRERDIARWKKLTSK